MNTQHLNNIFYTVDFNYKGKVKIYEYIKMNDI